MYLDYESAKQYIKNLNFKNKSEWRIYTKNNNFPNFLYKRPENHYLEFETYPVFLGYSNIVKKRKDIKNFLKYEESSIFVQNLKIKTQKQWKEWYKNNNPVNLPYNPNEYYTEWDGYGKWLGTNNIKCGLIPYYDYLTCFNIVKNEKIHNKEKYAKWVNIQSDIKIPKRPDSKYKNNGWVDWDTFLSHGKIAPVKKCKLFITYIEAVLFLKELDIKNQYDYIYFIEENNINFLPKRPDYVYKKEWSGYNNYLSKKHSDIQSYGEFKIEEFLIINKIHYIKEHTFDTCKNIKNLRFDFYLPSLNICVEYDGEQHFIAYSLYGGENALNITKKHDKIKNKWCKNNKIKLIRIPYNKKRKIYSILEEELYII